MGQSGTVALLSFAAFLLGSMLVIPRNPFKGRRRDWDDSEDEPILSMSGLWAWTSEAAERLDQEVTLRVLLDHPGLSQVFKDRLRQSWHSHYAVDLDQAGRQVGSHDLEIHLDDRADVFLVQEAILGAVRNEFKLLAVRLQVEREALWNDYDRLRSEAELRYSIFIPLMALVLISGVTWHWSGFVAAVIPVVLLAQAMRTEEKANAQIWTAVIHGVIESPTVAALSKLSPEAPPMMKTEPARQEFPESPFFKALAELRRLRKEQRSVRRNAQT